MWMRHNLVCYKKHRTMIVVLHCDMKIDHMLQALQFMSINSVCVLIYKILNNTLPVSLRNKIVIVGNENQRLTRQARNIVLDSGRSEGYKKRVVCM